MTKQLIDWKIYCWIPSDAYAQTYEDNVLLNNTEAPGTLFDISLGPTEDKQGRYFSPNMATLKIIKQYHPTRLPVPKETIQAVEKYAKKQEMKNWLDFFDRNKNLIPNNNESNNSDSTETSDLENENNFNTSIDINENEGSDSNDDRIPQLMSRDNILDSSYSDDNIKMPQCLTREFDTKSDSDRTKIGSKRISITLCRHTQKTHKTHKIKNIWTTQEDRLQELCNKIICKLTMIKFQGLNQ